MYFVKQNTIILISFSFFYAGLYYIFCFAFTIQHGKTLIKLAAARGQREIIEILFPRTKPIPSLPDWSVNGIIRTMKSPHMKPQVCKLFLTSFQYNLYSWSLMVFSIQTAVIHHARMNSLCCILLDPVTSSSRSTHTHELCLHPWIPFPPFHCCFLGPLIVFALTSQEEYTITLVNWSLHVLSASLYILDKFKKGEKKLKPLHPYWHWEGIEHLNPVVLFRNQDGGCYTPIEIPIQIGVRILFNSKVSDKFLLWCWLYGRFPQPSLQS